METPPPTLSSLSSLSSPHSTFPPTSFDPPSIPLNPSAPPQEEVPPSPFPPTTNTQPQIQEQSDQNKIAENSTIKDPTVQTEQSTSIHSPPPESTFEDTITPSIGVQPMIVESPSTNTTKQDKDRDKDKEKKKGKDKDNDKQASGQSRSNVPSTKQPQTIADIPLVGDIAPLLILKQEYTNNIIREKISNLSSDFGLKYYRGIRGDGNCFYRAVALVLTENLSHYLV